MSFFNTQNKYMLIFLAFLIYGCSSDPFPSIDLPVYQNSISIHHEVNKPANGVKSVFYHNNISFPANELIAFYDKKFGNSGYVLYSEDGYGMRRWENYNPESGEWEPTSQAPCRYISTWTDGSKKVRVILSMRYEYNPNRKNGNADLFVSCTVSPFFDFKNMESAGFPN
jgi:hypothetical protein